MIVYLDLVMLLNFLVDFLLILGVNRFTGCPNGIKRAAIGGAIGGIYSGVCMLSGFQFLGSWFWRIVFLIVISVISFGYDKNTVRRCALFVLLNMALGGIAMGIGNGGFAAVLCAAGLVVALCAFSSRGNVGHKEFVTVEIFWRGQVRKLTALRDTGNQLSDPITGQQVLIAGADIARELVGLSQQQLSQPVETVAQQPISGLRLIPYRTVGQLSGMLLALRMDRVLIDGLKGNSLVAFSPVEIGNGEIYQALTGG